MYIDLCVRPESVEELKAIANLALRLNYRAIAVEGINSDLSSISEKLIVIRRSTYASLSLAGEMRRAPPGALLVYELGDASAIRALDRLLKNGFHMLKLTCRALTNIRRDHVRRLRNCGIPVEIVFNEFVSDGKLSHGSVRGFNKILPYVEGGDVELVLSSGARDHLELLHPTVAVAFLRELGLSHLTSLKSLTASPKRVLEAVKF